MLINQTKRIYMNEADASPGNGAPAASPDPAPSAAQPTPDTAVDAVKSAVGEMLTGFRAELTTWRNGFFADARKAGALKQDKPQSEPSAQPAQPTPSAPAAAQAGLSMADVEALLERERVIATRAAKHGLSEAQTRRLKSSLSGVPADSFASEVDSYLADMGLAKVAPPQPVQATQQPAAPAPAKPNISDRGTAAPTDLRDSEGVLNSRPLEMTGHDVDALVLKYGQEKGMQMFQERVLAALGKVRIKPPRG